ncbi:ParB/RepB/Spo0J family partition protein [Palleronia caenipelagi]|uniref:Replication protein n=1 Tax=Palleronia caenipelagi TaxID=2489174 RepID=A0A547PUJ9_9RHOB|nr:ParB N-terminal domain-containing protein [Palleronia caenipelagi]TRD17734.1 replication protein [Palleronia caenipelagi]
MTRKRRMFDIALPDDAPEAPPPDTSAPPRRGPMASAIAENAEALKARQAAQDAIREENDALAHEFVALREAGHVVQELPLGDIHTYMLTRDRMPGEDAELAELVTSIREVGLSNPIRVVPRPDGSGYELVQGYRRLAAYRALESEGQGGWDRIPALIMPGEADIAGLYRRMVDENVIRKDLSFAEMAQAAMNYAADPATEAMDLSAAVAALFQSAPYSKRSYIRSFAALLERLGDVLAYPTEIPRALGVALAREIKSRPEIVAMIRERLDGWDTRAVADELEVLRSFTVTDALGDVVEQLEAPDVKARTGRAAKTKTTFHLRSSAGQVKCTASQGRLEIKVDRDFSAIERARLEQAIMSLIDGLG